MGLLKVLFFAALVLIAVCDGARAELYHYVDEQGALHVTSDRGSIPERYRGTAQVVADVDRETAPNLEELSNELSKIVQGQDQPNPGRTGSPTIQTPAQVEAAQTEPQSAHPDTPQQQVVTITTGTQPVSAETNFIVKLFEYMLQEKFKDVKDPSQIPALNADTAVDCTKYKKILEEDNSKLDLYMKVTDEKRKRGELGLFGKMRAVYEGLRLTVNFIYDIAFTPKHCSEELERENEERLKAIGEEKRS